MVSVKRANCVNTEVTSATPSAPEQVRILRSTGASLAAIGGHHIGRDQVINGHAMFPAEPTKPASQSEAGNACGGIDTQRRGQPMHLCSRVKVRQCAAGPNKGAPVFNIHFYVLHLR